MANKVKSKHNRLPIYARVTFNDKRAEISLALQCNIEAWDERVHRVKGRSSEATFLFFQMSDKTWDGEDS